MKPKPIEKLYYSIGEVSRLTDVKPHVLRYWETEFAELRPSKNRAGNRTYRPREIKLILLIKHLLYEEKYTIEGARKKIKEIMKRPEALDQIVISVPSGGDADPGIREELRKKIADIRKDIKEIAALLNLSVGT